MAALALIFAIQDYEPSPFYYFDEVDQNLDTFNAENIASLCRLRSKQAQFIMVTLRKVSLQLADHHIGVTHAGDGCSRLITDFDREQALEVGDAAHEELKAIKATEEKKKELEGLPKTADMARAPEEVEAPTSLGGIDLGEPVEADELELDAETELAESDLPLTEVAAEVAAELELDAESDLPLAEGDTESEVEFTEDTSLISLADRAEDFKEDMDDKLSVALPIEQEQRDELDARDAEETEEDAEAGEVEIEVPSEDEVE
jgi:chromosome segregation protein